MIEVFTTTLSAATVRLVSPATTLKVRSADRSPPPVNPAPAMRFRVESTFPVESNRVHTWFDPDAESQVNGRLFGNCHHWSAPVPCSTIVQEDGVAVIGMNRGA